MEFGNNDVLEFRRLPPNPTHPKTIFMRNL
jgi:hypothetical protein